MLDLHGFGASISGLTVQSSDATAVASSTVTNSATAATLTINNSADFSYPGVITGAVAVTKNGAGMQTLAGSNTYSGETDINAGVLSVLAATSSAGVVKVNTSVASAGTLAGTGSVGAVTLAADNGANRARRRRVQVPPREASAR